MIATAKRRRRSYTSQKDFAKDAAIVLLGGATGVVVDKIVGDVLLKFGIPNPQVSSIQTHDVVLVGSELAGAYIAKKKNKPQASKFLVGMAAGVVVTDVYEAVAASGRWIAQQQRLGLRQLGNSGQGRYGRTAQVTGATYLKPIPWRYSPR